jgi:hypothetical protein
MELVERYPEGIVTVEKIKTDNLKISIPDIILNWTDRLSGMGIDNTGVNVSHYNFFKCEGSPKEASEPVICDKEGVSVYLSADLLDEIYSKGEDTRTLFIGVNIGNEKTQFFGLILPSDHDGTISYRIDNDRIHNITVSEGTEAVIDKAAVYSDGKLFDIDIYR